MGVPAVASLSKLGDVDGRARRKVLPRRSLGDWSPSLREQDPIAALRAQEGIRDPELLTLRYGRMGASPWTYYRGAAAVMAADLAVTPNSGITVQLCGDAHILNFGLWNTPERRLAFDLRDFDETLPGPFEWDLKRYLASIVVLARENGLRNRAAREAVRLGYRGYRQWIRKYADWPELDIWYDVVGTDRFANYAQREDDQTTARLLERADTRTSRGAFDKLTAVKDGRRRIAEKPPYRTHKLTQHAPELEAAIRRYLGSLPDHVQRVLGHFDLVDVVQQVVGVGSVGMRVFLLLAEERRTGDPLFMQFKQAGPSVYEPFLGPSRYPEHGQRVVNGQRLLQSASDAFLGWTDSAVGDGHAYYVAVPGRQSRAQWRGNRGQARRLRLCVRTRAGPRPRAQRRCRCDQRLPRQVRPGRGCVHEVRIRLRRPDRPRPRAIGRGDRGWAYRGDSRLAVIAGRHGNPVIRS